MMPDMSMISARELHRNLSACLNRAEKGERISIVRKGKVIASIVPGKASRAKAESDWEEHFAWLKSQPEIPDDFVERMRQEEGR